MSPFVLVLFGATGDLAKNKLFPSLFSLFVRGELSTDAHIVGFSRRNLSEQEFLAYVKEILSTHASFTEELWSTFSKTISYQQGLFDEEKGYLELIEKLNRYDEQIGACITRIFYLATPPSNYPEILKHLSRTKLSEGCGQGSDKWTRIAIEKPFGKDLETAKELDTSLSDIFEERQIFRVDHYLGKETVQNMLAFRFANSIFEPVWNKEYIDHVQITFAEKKGIGTRGKFFDGVGILRDVAQNHLLQLLAAVVMEQPKSFTKESVRDARAKAIEALLPVLHEDEIVAGQYDGYLEEKDVNPTSQTETFVALKIQVNTPRFEGVPFYIRAGKMMPENLVEINIVFIQTCHVLFKEYGCPEIGNVLKIRIQPNEGIGLRVIAKNPGSGLALGTVDMKFSYESEFGHKGMDAYEKLLLDILVGDQMLFNRSDELQSSWIFITEILKKWEKKKQLFAYVNDIWGPNQANTLIEKDGRHWL